ncbi:hypothetical protein LWI29_037758 [Acer saccharum]|uniref:DUF8040 domain-containing protein n=1 Tax=Acer saccharum TaxID=4024 RepID=A0AA39SRJ1_ACESA|nr:hypothetical protein LWI29_037758 [Acer saccharum]
MDRNTFAMLCELLKTRGGLLDDGNVTIEEQVATFIHILAHHVKNRSIQVRFYRSGETISRYVHRVLLALLHLEDVLFVKPTPVPDDCTDSRWRWFKGCLRALDGTYIEMNVPESDKPRMYMDVDPEEYTPVTLDELPIGEDIPNEFESIDVVEASDEWSQWRNDLAEEMFDTWMSRRT